MGLIIDTSVIVAAERGGIDFNKWVSYESAYISSITVSELLVGVYRASNEQFKIKRSAFVEHVISSFEVLSFDQEAARVYAQVLQHLFEKNITLGVHDLLIGSIAIVHDCSVLTANPKDFNRIPGVKVLSID